MQYSASYLFSIHLDPALSAPLPRGQVTPTRQGIRTLDTLEAFRHFPHSRNTHVKYFLLASITFAYSQLNFQVRTYLLLRSILWQLAAIAEGLRPDGDDEDLSISTTTSATGNAGGGAFKQSSAAHSTAIGESGSWGPRDLLIAGLCTLRLLRANMYHLRAAGVSPGTVGLGTSSGPSSLAGGRRESGGGRRGGSGSGVSGGSSGDQRSPFASGLLTLLLDYAGGVLDVIPAGGDSNEEKKKEEKEGEESMASLRRTVRREAAEVVGQGLEIFLPEAAQKVELLTALLRLVSGGSIEHGNDDEEDSKEKNNEEEDKTWGGRRSNSAAMAAAAAAAAAAMADGPLPVDMDEEGCSALLSGVCNAVCSDPNLLLSLVPESVRPPLAVRDVPFYVAAKVRSAAKARAQALHQWMLKQAAVATTTVAATPPNSGSGGGGSPSPRLSVSRGQGTPVGGGNSSNDNERSGLWKSGPTAGLPRSGDVVIRGPDWAWGGQDESSAYGRGLVVALASWGRAAWAGGGSNRGSSSFCGGGDSNGEIFAADAVRVMWEKGAINIYRWGAVDSSALGGVKPCYDLKVLRAPPVAQDESSARVQEISSSGIDSKRGSQGGQGQGRGKSRSVRGELKWSVPQVEAALLSERGGGRRSGGGDGVLTPREVLRFIKNNAPQEWREPRRITGAENALVKVNIQSSLPPECICWHVKYNDYNSKERPSNVHEKFRCL